jgi:hypothetical protein
MMAIAIFLFVEDSVFCNETGSEPQLKIGIESTCLASKEIVEILKFR